MPVTRPARRWFLRVVVLLLGLPVLAGIGPGATAAAAQRPIEIRPPVPRPTDVFEIAATYQTSCVFERGEVDVSGRTIVLTAVERGPCLPGLPGPFTFVSHLGPLAPGPYTVDLRVLLEDGGGQPALVATEGFEIRPDGGPGRLAIEPFPPTPADPVFLTVRTHCPAQTTVDPPEISDGEITVIERVNNAILAPCFEGYVDVDRFELGTLAEGDYTLRLFTVETDLLGGGEVPEDPSLEVSFTVAENPRLTLGDGRFEVEARWRTSLGTSGFGRPTALTSDTGTFWFFDPDNVEVVVKVLDACSFAGHFWVFAAGLTNVEVELRVVDTVAQAEEVYFNPLGRPFEPIQDAETFATCDVVSP